MEKDEREANRKATMSRAQAAKDKAKAAREQHKAAQGQAKWSQQLAKVQAQEQKAAGREAAKVAKVRCTLFSPFVDVGYLMCASTGWAWSGGQQGKSHRGVHLQRHGMQGEVHRRFHTRMVAVLDL